MKNVWKYIKNPLQLVCFVASKGGFDYLTDEQYIKLLFRVNTGKQLDIGNPRTFNEKIQWLKLYNHNPLYTTMVDKYEAKKYISGILGDQYIIPTLGVWDDINAINFDNLPDQFVLKTTHDSGGVVICKDKQSFDIEAAKKKLEKSLKNKFFMFGREWSYKNVKPRIIAEEYLENDADGLHDYKIWCFNGTPEYVQYISGINTDHSSEGFYNRDWQLQSFSYHNPLMKNPAPRPVCLDELLACAKTLAKDCPFVRCDFYVLEDGSIRFGEMTFYPMSGMETWKPAEQDRIMGDKIDLSLCNIKSN